MDSIQVKCPNDGSILKVRNIPGIEQKSLTCPVCKQKMPFSKMIVVNQDQREERGTQYPGQGANPGAGQNPYMQNFNQQPEADYHTQLPEQNMMQGGTLYGNQGQPGMMPPPIPGAQLGMQQGMQQGVGYLLHRPTGMRFPLRPGVNVIGRQASRSLANVQLPSTPMRRMSREHIKIDVQPMGNTNRYLCSLVKPDCNPVFINGMPLQYGNCFMLQPGMVISLPDCEVVFSL